MSQTIKETFYRIDFLEKQNFLTPQAELLCMNALFYSLSHKDQGELCNFMRDKIKRPRSRRDIRDNSSWMNNITYDPGYLFVKKAKWWQDSNFF